MRWSVGSSFDSLYEIAKSDFSVRHAGSVDFRRGRSRALAYVPL